MWLVARTDRQKELWAEANIQNQGYTAYLPRYRERMTPSGKVRKLPAAKLLFPGYIFCYTDGPWTFLTGTRGVTTVLMSGSKPGIVPDDVIAALKSQEDNDGYVMLPNKMQRSDQFERGSKVRLRAGPFLSYIGIYDGRTTADLERVLLNCFGRQTVVRVNLEDIEKAED